MNRKVTIKKAELIATLKKNKAAHIVDYNEGVEAYKKEAKEQLEKQLKALEEGSLKIELQLTHPVNREAEYDKIISLFEWEVSDVVDLLQSEFNEYVLDEIPSIIQARGLNSMYKAKFL